MKKYLPVILATIVVSIVVFLIRERDINELKTSYTSKTDSILIRYEQLQAQIDKASEESQNREDSVHISKQEFDSLLKEVNNVRLGSHEEVYQYSDSAIYEFFQQRYQSAAD